MKTAISIPDEVFEAADRTARKLGVSRSELYAKAVREYIERYRAEDVTAELDEVYSANESALDPHLKSLQVHTLKREHW